MRRLAVFLFAPGVLIAALVGASARGADAAGAPDDTAAMMRQIGQAMMMYATENKGHYPPDLRRLSPYIRENADAVITRAQAELAYAAALTNIAKIKSPAQHAVAVQKAAPGEPILILFADGRVDRYAPSPAAGDAKDNRKAAPPPTSAPAASGQGLVGAWHTTVGFHDATYQFNQDGTFTLTFTPTAKMAPHLPQLAHTRPAEPPERATAGGTWRLDGKRLVMTNTSSTTPFTVVGEIEEAELVSVDADELVLKTVDNKGKPEELRFARRTPFEKGKHDDPRIVGTWRGEQTTLVLAETGVAVLFSMKGEWSQGGKNLAVKLAGRSQRLREMGRGLASQELDFTIDVLDENTLVLTADVFGGEAITMTFLRVK